MGCRYLDEVFRLSLRRYPKIILWDLSLLRGFSFWQSFFFAIMSVIRTSDIYRGSISGQKSSNFGRKKPSTNPDRYEALFLVVPPVFQPNCFNQYRYIYVQSCVLYFLRKDGSNMLCFSSSFSVISIYQILLLFWTQTN